MKETTKALQSLVPDPPLPLTGMKDARIICIRLDTPQSLTQES